MTEYLHVQSTHCTPLIHLNEIWWLKTYIWHYACISSYNLQIIKNTYLNKNFAILWIPECENLNGCLEFRSVKSIQIHWSVYSAWTSWIVFYVSLVPKAQRLHQRSIVLMLAWFGYERWLTGGFCKCSTALRAHFQELQGPPSCWEQWVHIIWSVPGTQHSFRLIFFLNHSSEVKLLLSHLSSSSYFRLLFLPAATTDRILQKKSFPVLFRFFHIDGKFPGGSYSKFQGVFILKFETFKFKQFWRVRCATLSKYKSRKKVRFQKRNWKEIDDLLPLIQHGCFQTLSSIPHFKGQKNKKVFKF